MEDFPDHRPTPFYVIGIGKESGEGITDGNVGLGIWDADSPEALANARLIAAAPDLVEALKWIAEDGASDARAVECARAALSKAGV